MNDSINVVLEGVEFIEKSHLDKLGIKDFKIFGPRQYSFTYKDVHFKYYKDFRNLAIETTTHKILKKKDILLSDKIKFINQLNNIINEVLNTKDINYNIRLTQIDYCCDLKVGEEAIEDYAKILNKHLIRYKRKEKKCEYKESIQITTKKGGILKVYDKEAEIENKFAKINKQVSLYNEDKKTREEKLKKLDEIKQNEIEKYKGVIRLEIAVRKNTLKYYEKTSIKEHKRNNKVPIVFRTIDNYWSKEKMKKHFFNEFKSYLYQGDYYKLDKAIDLVKSSKLSNSWKEKLIEFLQNIAESSIQDMKDNMQNGTYRNYIKNLNIIGVNPITIDADSQHDYLKSLYTMARKQAEQVYFDKMV